MNAKQATPMNRFDDLAGKVAIITGGARGIGFASARLLAEHGAKVVIADVRSELAQVSCDVLAADELESLALELDVKDPASVTRMAETVMARFGRIDILVNNAGIVDTTPMLELSVEAWDNLIDINLRGMQLCTQACLQRMLGQGSGKVVFMASRAGEMGSLNVAPSYSASKGGALALAKAYALYCAPYNINCNAIAPGYIETDMTKGRDDPNSVPIQRLGTALDVAKSVYFLCSDLSDYITGAVIDVNGGLYIR